MNKLRKTINEMKLMLNDTPSLTLANYLSENFILPENFDEESFNDDVQMAEPQTSSMQQQMGEKERPIENKISGIEKELTQIRKIALNVITRLADQPSSEQYILMKKIWNTVDKAIENGNEKTENV